MDTQQKKEILVISPYNKETSQICEKLFRYSQLMQKTKTEKLVCKAIDSEIEKSLRLRAQLLVLQKQNIRLNSRIKCRVTQQAKLDSQFNVRNSQQKMKHEQSKWSEYSIERERQLDEGSEFFLSQMRSFEDYSHHQSSLLMRTATFDSQHS